LKRNGKLTYQCNLPDSAFTLSDGREFCSQCQKSVIDFTEMSDEEIRQYVAFHSGSLCVKIDSDQLRRVKGKKSSLRQNLAGAATVALLALATESKGQVADSVRTEQVENSPADDKSTKVNVPSDSSAATSLEQGKTLKEPEEGKRRPKKKVFLRLGRREFYVMNKFPFFGTRKGGLRGKF
jgi:hypothetical protein